MTVGVTGPNGFLGWHLRCRLLSQGIAFVGADRSVLEDPAAASQFVKQAGGTIFHVAGVNRAASDEEVRLGNIAPAAALAKAIAENDEPTSVIYANSVKADVGGPYGEAKSEAGHILRVASEASGGTFFDARFPHLFGEFGIPFYNSAVTTFAHQVVIGEEPTVRDGLLELLHAQDAAQLMIEASTMKHSGLCRPAGVEIGVRAANDLIGRLAEPYVSSFTFPDVADEFELRIFNMIRSQMWPDRYPYLLTQHADRRGAFFEATRAFGQGQTSISTTVPGVVRGEHYHFDKIERFVVVSGKALIRVRKLFSDRVIEFPVSGEVPAVVDMPPLCTHDITNTGAEDLITMFWSHDHFDPDQSDTYPLPVSPDVAVA